MSGWIYKIDEQVAKVGWCSIFLYNTFRMLALFGGISIAFILTEWNDEEEVIPLESKLARYGTITYTI